MSYSCKILLDSISETGKRITTFELTYPRMIHSEFMTHGMFSRNAASSRAIPVNKMLEMVKYNPYVPEQFPLNAKGMQPQEYISKTDVRYTTAEHYWINAMEYALSCAKRLTTFGIHKQIANRLLEPFLWYTCIVTATEFDNFFKLRCDENAQYEIKRIADLMYEAYHAFDNIKSVDSSIIVDDNELTITKPQKLKVGEWHCPLVYEEDNELIRVYVLNNLKLLLEEDNLKCNTLAEEYNYINKISISLRKRVSVARCARVSYLTHDGKRDIEKDLELFERLRTSGHWSPFEHVASPYYFEGIKKSKSILDRPTNCDDNGNYRSGNFVGWKQFRKEFADENCTNFRKEDQ